MKTIFLSLILILCTNMYAQKTITISGRVTDFEGNPIDSCEVMVLYTDF